MSEIYDTSLKRFLENNTIDDDARWFLELESTLELNPIRDYKNEMGDNWDSYEHSVILDLPNRIRIYKDLVESGLKSGRLNKRYAAILGNRLLEKCSDDESKSLLVSIIKLL